jgi:hypothetical protein
MFFSRHLAIGRCDRIRRPPFSIVEIAHDSIDENSDIDAHDSIDENSDVDALDSIEENLSIQIATVWNTAVVFFPGFNSGEDSSTTFRSGKTGMF